MDVNGEKLTIAVPTVKLCAVVVAVALIGAALPVPPPLPPPPHAATVILKSITKSNLVIFNFYLPESNLRLIRLACFAVPKAAIRGWVMVSMAKVAPDSSTFYPG